MALYRRGGGQHGKLSSVEQVSSIGEVSYIALKVYKNSINPRFRAQVTRLNTSRFEFIPALHFLSVVDGVTSLPEQPDIINLPSIGIDFPLYQTLSQAIGHVEKAIELSRRRKTTELAK